VPGVTGRGITARGVEKKNGRGPDPDDQPTVQIEKKGALTSHRSILTSAIFISAWAAPAGSSIQIMVHIIGVLHKSEMGALFRT